MCFPVHASGGQNSFPGKSGSESPSFLLARGWRLASAPGDHLRFVEAAASCSPHGPLRKQLTGQLWAFFQASRRSSLDEVS